MQRWLPGSLGLFLLLTVAAAPCRGVTILTKDREQPIKGFLISESEASVVVDELLPDGTRNRIVLPRTQINVMIKPVSDERLEELNCDQPQAYRDYADELYEKREDPDARATAIRLYLIAAWLDPRGQGRSCLLGMAALSRSADEERRFRAMGYLLDPDHDRAGLKQPTPKKVDTSAFDDAQRVLLLEGIRALRSGDRNKAKMIARRPGFEAAVKPLAGILTLDEFSEAAADTDVMVKPSMLKKLLTIELLLTGVAPAPTGDSKGTTRSWSQLIATGRTGSVTPLSLETITEFDPRECRFEKGKWVQPD